MGWSRNTSTLCCTSARRRPATVSSSSVVVEVDARRPRRRCTGVIGERSNVARCGRTSAGGGAVAVGMTGLLVSMTRSSAIILARLSCVQCIVLITPMLRRHDMELRRLRHLMAVAEHGNFGRAAAASYITQPALSRSIQALEAEVGAPAVRSPPERGRAHRHGASAAAPRHDARCRRPRPRPRDPPRQGPRARRAAHRRRAVGWRRARRTGDRSTALASPPSAARVVVAPWRELPARLRSRDVDIVVGELGEIEQLDEFEILGLSEHDLVVVGRTDTPSPSLAPPSATSSSTPSGRGWTPTPPGCCTDWPSPWRPATSAARWRADFLATIPTAQPSGEGGLMIERADDPPAWRRRRRLQGWPSSPATTAQSSAQLGTAWLPHQTSAPWAHHSCR